MSWEVEYKKKIQSADEALRSRSIRHAGLYSAWLC